MKILLSAANLCRDPYPVYPLGMSVIAGALAEAGHTVLQFDPLVYGVDRLSYVIDSFKPELIGISIRNLDTVNSRSGCTEILEIPCRIVKLIRSLTNVPIVLGGSGFSLLPKQMLELTGADYGIVGEGETMMLELVRELIDGRHDIPSVLRGISGPQASPLFQKDILDFYVNETHVIPLQTKRGCPFHCAYCTYPALEGHCIRTRPFEKVLKDLQAQYSPETLFYFVDAVFNDKKGTFRKFVRSLISSKLNIHYAAFVSPSGLTEEDILDFRKSGMVAAELGVDAATDATLKGLRKDFTFSEARRISELLLKNGIAVTTNVMFGGPGETPETILDGIDNLRTLEPAMSMIFSGIRIFKGTGIYDLALKKQMIPNNWNGLESLYYFEPGIDPEKLHYTLLEAFKGSQYFIYPPDRRDMELQMIHRMGYLKFRRLRKS